MNEGMENDSPGLTAVKPNFLPRPPTPPPFVPQEESPPKKPAGKEAHKSKQLQLEHGQAEADNALLRNSFAAYHPDLWGQNRENLLEPSPIEPSIIGVRHADPLDPLERSGGSDKSGKKPLEPPRQHLSPPKKDPKHDLDKTANEVLEYLIHEDVHEKSKLPPISVFDQPDEPRSPPLKQRKLERSQSPLSQTLSQFQITAPNSQNSLPPLFNPSTASSPDDSTRLPPIRDLGPVPPPPNGLPPRAGPAYPLHTMAVSPPSTRVEPSPRGSYHRLAPLAPPQLPPSPYSYVSPASTHAMSAVSSPVSQQTWRPKPSLSYPYDPPSAAPARSPASSYPTPIERPPAGVCDAAFTPSSQGSIAVPPGTFKCTHPGCTALPFQTQYLLNSHANVHSHDRPHFCPVEGCSRAYGGKGFKRKNEMIRHGLVHNSPGYVCPFCPDQQHKYPRPDNLQRHVRVHHVDKNKDDPALRNVLSQRPEGSGRGRRRRIAPQ